MAQIVLNIPDAVVGRVLDAVAATQGYVEGGSQTKAQFARAHVAGYVKEMVISYEASQAAREAANATRTLAEQEISIT
jgi:hypothetical protein